MNQMLDDERAGHVLGCAAGLIDQVYDLLLYFAPNSTDSDADDMDAFDAFVENGPLARELTNRRWPIHRSAGPSEKKASRASEPGIGLRVFETGPAAVTGIIPHAPTHQRAPLGQAC